MRTGFLFHSLSMLEQTSKKSLPDLLISGCCGVLFGPVLAGEQTRKIASSAGTRSRRTAASNQLLDSMSDLGCHQQRETYRGKTDGTAIQRIELFWALHLVTSGRDS